jgi:two-component system sensor histidine kinase ChvG
LLLLLAVGQPVGIIYFSQFQAGLLDLRAQDLRNQADIVAALLAATASNDSDRRVIVPDPSADPASRGSHDTSQAAARSITPERAAFVVGRLIGPVRVRAWIYDTNGALVFDSRFLYRTDRYPMIDSPPAEPRLLERASVAFHKLLNRGLPDDVPGLGSGNDRVEVHDALDGRRAQMLRIGRDGRTILTSAAPIMLSGTTVGAVILSRGNDDIDDLAMREYAVVTVFSLPILLLAGVLALRRRF